MSWSERMCSEAVTDEWGLLPPSCHTVTCDRGRGDGPEHSDYYKTSLPGQGLNL